MPEDRRSSTATGTRSAIDHPSSASARRSDRPAAASLPPRVGLGDDGADGLLVEPLVPLAALEVLQVAADGPLGRGTSTRCSSLIQPRSRSRSARDGSTGQRWPWVNAWRRNGKSLKGFMVTIPASASRSRRRASKSNWASRWCIPACRSDSPWRPTQRPTVFGVGRSGRGAWAKSESASSGARSRSAKMTIPAVGCSRTWAPQPACGAGVEGLAEVEAEPLEQARSSGRRAAASSGRCGGRGSPSRGRAGPAGPSGPGRPCSGTASSRARPRRRGGRPGRSSRPARSPGRGRRGSPPSPRRRRRSGGGGLARGRGRPGRRGRPAGSSAPGGPRSSGKGSKPR